MKVYVAGPMTGIPEFNIPAFDAAAAVLRREQFEVVSPAELDDPHIRAISLSSPDGNIATVESHGKTWGDFLARDVKLITDDGIDAIVVLDGWERSRGARLETFVANALNNIPVCIMRDYGDSVSLLTLSPIVLYRAWANEPDLSIAASFNRTPA